MAAQVPIVTMNVSLPQPLKNYVDDKVASGVYGSASEFVREAIREKYLLEHQRRQAKATLAAKLLDGLDSGESIPYSGSYFSKKKTALLKRIKKA